ncbi:MAG TPA: LysR family transcriptional regulator [Mycobacteriales bacterium]|nr:LysR family transcriptional regulator [Mycobacteriales bacterium]
MADGLPFDLPSLRLLTTVATTGSLGQAAKQLDITQPAASQRVRALERRLGLRLVERSTRGSRLTPAGAFVADLARTVLDAADQMHRGIVALRDEATAPVRIAASLTIADHLVPRWLGAWHAVAPELRVALQVVNSESVARLVREREVALGFVEGVRSPAGVRSRAVGGDELVVVVAPAHPWARRRRPTAAAELATAPLVLREPGSGTREAFEHALAAHGVTVTPILELGSTTAIKAAVMAGGVVAVVSRLAVTAELGERRLVPVPVPDLDLQRKFRAIWASGPVPVEPAATLLATVLTRSAAYPLSN